MAIRGCYESSVGVESTKQIPKQWRLTFIDVTVLIVKYFNVSKIVNILLIDIPNTEIS